MEYPKQEIAIVRELTQKELDQLLVVKTMYINKGVWSLVEKYSHQYTYSYEEFVSRACTHYVTHLSNQQLQQENIRTSVKVPKSKPLKIKKNRHHWYGDIPDEDLPLIEEHVCESHISKNSLLDSLKDNKRYHSY